MYKNMKDIQSVFDALQDKKSQRKELQAAYRDALGNRQDYSDVKDQLTELRDLKKSIEHEVQAEMGNDYDRLENLKHAIKDDQEMLSDIAVTQFMQGETVAITDQDNNEYEPVLSVTFKKI